MTDTVRRLPRDLPPPTSAANVKKRLAMVLASQVGFREGRSSNGDWNNDNPYGQYFHQNWVSYCNWFISWGAVAAGIPASVIPRTGYTPTSWNWFRKQNLAVTTPKPGDLFWVEGWVASEKANRVHHIGFVDSVLSGGRIRTLEGNTNNNGSAQGNGVYQLVRPITSKLKFARPNYQAAVQATKPPTGNTAKPPSGTITEENPMAGLTPEDQTVLTNAFKAALKDEAANDSGLLTFDNKHDAQVLVWQIAFGPHAERRYAELTQQGKSGIDACVQIRDELWGPMSALWSDGK